METFSYYLLCLIGGMALAAVVCIIIAVLGLLLGLVLGDKR